jgi:WD40 repeat protein
LHNAIYLEEGESSLARPLLLRAQRVLSPRGWLRLTNRPPFVKGQSALVRVLETGDVFSLSWARDGRRLFTGGSKGACIWDVGSGQTIVNLREARGPIARAIDGSLFAMVGDDGSVRVFDEDGTLQSVLAAHRGRVWTLAWSPDGNLLASGGEDHSICLWYGGREPAAVLKGHTSDARALAWSADGTLLASADRGGVVRLWKRDEGWASSMLEGHKYSVLRLAWSSKENLLASAGWDDLVRIWEKTGQLRAAVEGHKGAAWAVA